jgi:hypothetical protein
MLLPSPRSAVCIIDTSVELREFRKGASSCLSPLRLMHFEQGQPVSSRLLPCNLCIVTGVSPPFWGTQPSTP